MNLYTGAGREGNVGGRRPEAGSRRQEAGGRRQAAGGRRQEAESRRQKAEGRGRGRCRRWTGRSPRFGYCCSKRKMFMDFVSFTWLFVLVVAAHNLEEAIWLPAWSRTVVRWHQAVGNIEFRFAVIVMTLVAIISAWLATVQGRAGLGAYLVTGYALAMLLNVLFPHVVASLVLKRYMPGTATAVLLNLPVTIGLLLRAFRDGYVEPRAFLIFGPMVVIGIVASIPLLFRMGRMVSMRR